MRRLSLRTQIILFLALPVVIEFATLFAGFPELYSRAILFLCLLWLTLGCLTFYLSIIPRISIVKENAYRYANNLAGLSIPGANDEIAQIDELVRKVYLKLESTTDRYKACLANSADVICAFRSSLKFSMANDAVRRLWQYDPYHLVGRLVTEFVYPEDIAVFETAMQSTIESGVPVNANFRLIRRDGSLCWTAWAITWVAKEDSFFCVTKDITEQKQIESIKREFVNMVSHDLRTPLMSLSVFADVLIGGEYGELNKRGLQMAENSRSSIKRLIMLVNDLLDLEKMEDGNFELELCELPIGEIIHDAVSSIEAYAQRKGISVECRGRKDIEVEADPQRMVQVVQNLLSNAIKFSPSDSTVIVDVESSASELIVRVKDEGKGIPAGKRDYIFDRFRQLPNSEGTGLGLAICQAIVTRHNGTIGVESNQPAGSVFWFRLPVSGEAQAMVLNGDG